MNDTRPLVSRRRLAAVALSGGLLALAGCSGSSGSGGAGSSRTAASPTTASPTASPTASASATGSAAPRIVIKDFAFHPATLTVRPGAEVTVVNQDSTAHTVTATKNKAFDTGTVDGGKSMTFTAPKAAGAYAYICTIHPFMKGTLTVH